MKPAAQARGELWHMPSEVYLFAGGFVLGFAVIVIGLTGWRDTLLAICLPAGVIPGAAAVAYGIKVRLDERAERARDEALKDFASYVKTYRRIGLDDLAKNLGRPRIEAERMLAEAVQRGHLQGVIDRAAQEFVVQEAVPHQVFVGKCPHCGGIVDRWAFPEESFVCPYCDRPVRVTPDMQSTAPRHP
jgi:hypothetical protein